MTEKRAILGLIKSDFQPHQTFIINYDDSVTIPKATIELKIIQTMMELSSDGGDAIFHVHRWGNCDYFESY